MSLETTCLFHYKVTNLLIILVLTAVLAQACLKQIGTKLMIVTILKRLKTCTWDCDCYCNQLYHNIQFTTIIDFLCDAVFHSTLKTRSLLTEGNKWHPERRLTKAFLTNSSGRPYFELLYKIMHKQSYQWIFIASTTNKCDIRVHPFT